MARGWSEAVAVVVCGPPASGKSTLARAVAGRLAATVLDLDTITGPMTAVVAGLLGTVDLDDPELVGVTRAARYESVVATAEDNLAAGRPVVLVAPFSIERRDPVAWHRLEARLNSAGSRRVVLVWLQLEGDELLRRMTARAAERDQAKLAGAAKYLARLDLDPPAVAHLAVDATDALDALCAVVLDHLSSS